MRPIVHRIEQFTRSDVVDGVYPDPKRDPIPLRVNVVAKR